MPDSPRPLPDFTNWPSFPFEGDLRVKQIDEPVAEEPARAGEDPNDCTACAAPDEAYIYVNERWRVRAMDRPTGLPIVLILESRSHLDLGDLPNMLAAELGVMTVRLERAIRSLDGVGRVHVNRWGDGAAHLHVWFLARPYGRLQLRGTFLSLWDDILPAISDAQWRENLAMVAAWLAEFGGTPLAQPPRIQWKAPSNFNDAVALGEAARAADEAARAADEAARAGDEAGAEAAPGIGAAQDAGTEAAGDGSGRVVAGDWSVAQGQPATPAARKATGDEELQDGKPAVAGATADAVGSPQPPVAGDESETVRQ